MGWGSRRPCRSRACQRVVRRPDEPRALALGLGMGRSLPRRRRAPRPRAAGGRRCWASRSPRCASRRRSRRSACPSRARRAPAELAAFVSVDRRERALHAHGKGYRDVARAFAGDFSGAPDAVALPRDEEDVARILAWCERERLAVVPFGGGTSVVGGVERPGGSAWRGAIAVDLRAMDRVLEVDPVSRAARIQAGATGPRLEEQLAAHGLTLRHYPQSFEHSTLGGWIVTRAGGHFATLYTHVDDLVESVRMVTPRGRLRDPAAAGLRRGARARSSRARLGGDAGDRDRGVDARSPAAEVPRVGERPLRGTCSRERGPRGRSRRAASIRRTAACSTRARPCSTASRPTAARCSCSRSSRRSSRCARRSTGRSRSRSSTAARARGRRRGSTSAAATRARRRGGRRSSTRRTCRARS